MAPTKKRPAKAAAAPIPTKRARRKNSKKRKSNKPANKKQAPSMMDETKRKAPKKATNKSVAIRKNVKKNPVPEPNFTRIVIPHEASGNPEVSLFELRLVSVENRGSDFEDVFLAANDFSTGMNPLPIPDNEIEISDPNN